MSAVAEGKALKRREENFAKKPFKVVIAMHTKLFIAKRNIHAERYEFNTKKQKEGEKIQDFAYELEIMAVNCAFGDFLDQALRDQFITGLLDANIRENFFTLDSTLSFKEVVDIASHTKSDVQLPSTSSVKAPVKTHVGKRIKCKCGRIAKNIASSSKYYKGRALLKCAQNKCNFKKWADELEQDSAKPCPGPSSNAGGKPAAKPKCGICQQHGHNRLKCPKANANEHHVKQPTININYY